MVFRECLNSSTRELILSPFILWRRLISAIFFMVITPGYSGKKLVIKQPGVVTIKAVFPRILVSFTCGLTSLEQEQQAVVKTPLKALLLPLQHVY
jgi:hypothetical protein